MEAASISWSNSLEKMARVQFEWRVTDHGKFIAQVSGATEAATTTSVLLCAAADADGGAADWVKWIALSHESISVALHKVSLQPSCCLTGPKQTRERSFTKCFPPLPPFPSYSFLALILSHSALTRPPFLRSLTALHVYVCVCLPWASC